MNKVLIDTRDNSVHDVVTGEVPFPDNNDLVWVDDPSGTVTAATHNYDGTSFAVKPPVVDVPRPVDTTPGTIDVVKELMRLGVKKGDGTALVASDFSREFRDRLA